MARPTLMKLALVIALTIAAGTAYASSVISVTTPVGASSFAPSNNVSIGVVSTISLYAANSKHLNGDREIAFTSTDSRLYYSSGCPVASPVTAPGAATDYSTISGMTGWNSM
jgi:hypothetical protein